MEESYESSVSWCGEDDESRRQDLVRIGCSRKDSEDEMEGSASALHFSTRRNGFTFHPLLPLPLPCSLVLLVVAPLSLARP